MRIVMLGMPGAGKGTQARMIAERYGVPHISTGDIFRAEIKAGTELGRRVKEYTDSGGLVPDEVTSEIVRSRLRRSDCERGFVLDGYPRNEAQADFLEGELSSRGLELDAVVNIEIPEEEAVRRISARRVCSGCGGVFSPEELKEFAESPDGRRGDRDAAPVGGICPRCRGELYQRSDDSEEVVRERLRVYRLRTQPLIEYYLRRGLLINVDGVGEIEEVRARIEAALEGAARG